MTLAWTSGGEGTVFLVGQMAAVDVGNEGVFRGGGGFPGKRLIQPLRTNRDPKENPVDSILRISGV